MRGVALDDLIEAARAIAENAHRGVVDHCGEPYINHPLAVAASLESSGHGPEVIAAALLHDVVEDTDVTLDDLRRLGFPELVVEGVDAVTYRKGETRREFIARAVAHKEVGRPVKRADIDHNSDKKRTDALALVDAAKAARLMKKYEDDKAQIAEILQAEEER